MALKGVAKQTLAILREGCYINDKGQTVDFSRQQQAAENGTVLYRPKELLSMLHKSVDDAADSEPRIDVTEETTQCAARRLVENEGIDDLVLLNFASAKNPGGGFLGGAKAQEEDLARCSGLYPCLLRQPEYYANNRAESSLLYTDHIIYAPSVPWFRSRSRDRLNNVFLASVITAPAPNATQALRKNPGAGMAIEQSLMQRAGMVLAVARERGHRHMLLGAWGCGVFGNMPYTVATAFQAWLDHPAFKGQFDRVVFAIYDKGEKRILKSFKRCLTAT